MILFPNCKINLGLDVIRKRDDGYHEIRTLMYPVTGLADSLEIVPGSDPEVGVSFTLSGAHVDCHPDDNLVVKACRLMADRFGLGSMRVHLHKVVPSGAGLGGGSSDAAFAIRAVNSLFGLSLCRDQMERLAAELGSDTAFFISNSPSLCSSRGEVITPFDMDLSGYHIVIVKPEISVSTAAAYSSITTSVPSVPLSERLARPVADWRGSIANAFEEAIFPIHPVLGRVKESLYQSGALFASMSGSGSAIFGLFDNEPEYDAPQGCFLYYGVL